MVWNTLSVWRKGFIHLKFSNGVKLRFLKIYSRADGWAHTFERAIFALTLDTSSCKKPSQISRKRPIIKKSKYPIGGDSLKWHSTVKRRFLKIYSRATIWAHGLGGAIFGATLDTGSCKTLSWLWRKRAIIMGSKYPLEGGRLYGDISRNKSNFNFDSLCGLFEKNYFCIGRIYRVSDTHEK